MPSASANIRAKFIAQIEMSMTCVPMYSEPAAATRPRMVSNSGRPAATSEPKASTRITSVTGHEMSSDLSIADLLASLKSDHMPGAPVRLTSTPSAPRSASGPLRSSAARTMSLGFSAAPALTMAVWPSWEIDMPGFGASTVVTASSASSLRTAPPTACLKAGSSTVLSSECTTASRP